jgi:hypothetical protein
MDGWIQTIGAERIPIHSAHLSNGEHGPVDSKDLTIKRPPNVETDGVQFTVAAPGYLEIRFGVDLPEMAELPRTWDLHFRVTPAGSETSAILKTTLTSVKPGQTNFEAEWRFRHEGLRNFL